MDGRISLLLEGLDQAYDQRSWHGTNLRGALRGLDLDTLAWRPGPGRPNAWELALHAAYWKYAVLRQLKDLPRGAFPLKGSNWFPRPEEATQAAWKADLALLDRMHRELRAAVAELTPSRLDAPSAKKQWRMQDLIQGVAAHDLHHAGQIQLIKRLRAG
jgi:uncharacterized damage-inducible protein DinB